MPMYKMACRIIALGLALHITSNVILRLQVVMALRYPSARYLNIVGHLLRPTPTFRKQAGAFIIKDYPAQRARS